MKGQRSACDQWCVESRVSISRLGYRHLVFLSHDDALCGHYHASSANYLHIKQSCSCAGQAAWHSVRAVICTHAGTCDNPYSLAGSKGNSSTLTIDTCNAANSNAGFLRSLNGSDYVILLEPSPEPRIVTVTTANTTAGPSFDTFLAVSLQCTVEQTQDTGAFCKACTCHPKKF